MRSPPGSAGKRFWSQFDQLACSREGRRPEVDGLPAPVVPEAVLEDGCNSKEVPMRVFGWVLIVVSGAAILFVAGYWIYDVSRGHYEGGEWSTALVITGMLVLFALIPLLTGALLVRRAGRGGSSGSGVHLDRVDWLAIVVMGLGLVLLLASAATAAVVIVAGLVMLVWHSRGRQRLQ
jgi:hypothetical protein